MPANSQASFQSGCWNAHSRDPLKKTMDFHLLFKILNFALFVGLLGFLLRRPLREFWRDRAEALRLRIANALKKRTVAETQYKDLMGRLGRMTQEMRALVETMRLTGELEQQKILEQGREYAARLELATERIGVQELAKAREQLRCAAARAAIELAGRLIEERITPDDQRRLAATYLDRLEGGDFI